MQKSVLWMKAENPWNGGILLLRKTVIIGGGASGMAAAIAAAKEGDAVTILEHTGMPGKKLLSTGNGRCNLTNRKQELQFYHSENPSFPAASLKKFGYEETLRFFSELGLFFKERDGYFYPRALQAQAVREALLSGLLEQGVELRTGCLVKKIETEIVKEGSQEARQFLVRTMETSFLADGVILACGGMAAPFTGSDGSGYHLAEAMGHHVILPVPALTGLLAVSNPLKKAAGVRADGTISLYIEENGKRQFTAADTGELQITDYGVSGIPVFQVSRYAARAIAQKKKVFAAIDFLPEYPSLENPLSFALEREGSCFRTLCGLFPEKLSAVFLKRSQIPLHAPAKRIALSKKETLIRLVREFPLEIAAVNGFEKAQVTAGGVDTREVRAETMESKLVPGLYFAGELLDVDGSCGGYNLQWAWASGFLAGKQGRL